MVISSNSHTFIFGEIGFFQLYQKLQSLVKKAQGILGVNMAYNLMKI
jgi:hypothetical protein